MALSMIRARLPDVAGVSGYSAAAFAAAVVVLIRLSLRSKLDAIPTAGSSTWLGSWWAGFKYVNNALEVIQEGYEKHKKAPFKVAVLHRWMVVLSSREHVEELRRAPGDAISFLEGVNDKLQVEYTLGHGIHHKPYHITVIRSQLTRNIGLLYPEMKDELSVSFDDILALKGNEWKSLPAFRIVQEVICRTTNRLFFGLPLCRDPNWIDLSLQFTHYVVGGAVVIKLFPTFLKPLAARLFTNVTRSNARGRKFLAPIIEERKRRLAEYGTDWSDLPNDLLSWLMQGAEGDESELTIKELTTRILTCNFVAIHTSSTSFTNALFYLAANPQYIKPLREEVESIVEKEGWCKGAIGKMRKIDSFMRESERMQGFSGVSLLRKALKDYTFSDGTMVPKGTMISAASRAIHFDETLYPNPHAFEPFRFADLRDEDGEGIKHQFASTTADYLAFGHGRNACPGRFFAANELKSMLAHLVVTYDVKLEEDAARPQTLYIGPSMVPDPTAKVMFRRRVD